jgi:RHS repeat-associated protein
MNLFRASHKTQVIRPQNPYLMKQTDWVCLQNTYDYSAFGVSLDGRTMEGDFYRYGFQGMEGDSEVKDEGNSYTTEFRQYDPRIGRWLTLDPLMAQFPRMSPYTGLNNNPISIVDPKGLKGEWHPEKDGDGKNILVADKGDDLNTLKDYLKGIYGTENDVSHEEMDDLSMQVQFLSENTENGNIEGHAIGSENGTFDNLVGEFLNTKSQEDPNWGITTFPGNNCSPTTFNRVDKAMEFVYGKDVLGKMSWSNSKYRLWQGDTKTSGDKYATGVLPENNLGTLIDENGVLNGQLTTGAPLRLIQYPGPGGTKVSWHAVLFLNYNFAATGEIIGMTYWQQAGRRINTITFKYNNGGVYDFSNGYKPKLGVNFE